MNIHAHILNFNEERMLPYTLRHYETFCSQLFVHDLGSHDRSHSIAKSYGARIIQHDTHQKFDDLLNAKIKSNLIHDKEADWVIAADCDELIYCPDNGYEAAFTAYSEADLVVVKPQGYDMVSDKFPTTAGQIYDEIKHGSREDRWYSKPIIFAPKKIKDIVFSVGAHEVAYSRPGMGMSVTIDHRSPATKPICFLLHFHHIDTLDAIAKKYDQTKARYSENNIKYHWGWQGEGMDHAKAKREGILANLEQVVK